MANIPTANNNPGDLKTSTGSFQTYSSPAQGYLALAADIHAKMTGATSTSLTPNSTLADFANVWAPASDNNNPTAYANSLSKQLNVPVNTPISALQPRLRDLTAAVAKQEGFQGQQPTMSTTDFASKIKAEYPQYKNIDDQLLTQKILAKYPQYGAIIAPDTTNTPSISSPINSSSNSNFGTNLQSIMNANPSEAGSLGNALTANEQNFGSSIGGVIAANTPDYKNYLASTQNLALEKQKVIAAIQQKEAAGGDASDLIAILQKVSGQSVPTPEQVNPVLNKTPEQIAGEGLGVATDILGAGSLSGVGEEATAAKGLLPSIVQGAKTGAKYGGAFGIAQGVSQGLQNNQGVSGVVGSGAVGGLTGATGGAVLGGALGGAFGNRLSQSDIEKQAIKDTTPAYSKSLIGEPDITVKNPDGTVTRTPRIQEGGLAKGRTITPTTAEIAAGKELAKIPNYPVNGTALEKLNTIEPQIAKEAQALQDSLENEKILRPPKEVAKVVRTAINDAADNSVLLQKTDPIVKSYMQSANRIISQSDGTLAGELKVRQGLDDAYEAAGGKYGNNKGLDQIHRAARNALTDDIEAKATNTEVKASLKRQSNLYNAKDVLQDKVKAEGGGSRFGQFTKAHPALTRFAKTVGLAAEGGEVLKHTGILP